MDTQLIGIILMLLLGGGLLAGLYIAGRDQEEGDPLMRRLQEYGDRELPASLDELEMSLSRKERIVVPAFNALAGVLGGFAPENQIQMIQMKLDRAGKTEADPSMFFAQRIFLTVVLGIGGFVLFFFLTDWPVIRAVIGTVVFTLLGYFLPMLQLTSQIKKRQDGIVKALPDALDLMTICVEAGLSFDMAMGKVYEKWDSDLAQAFGRVLQEIQLGKLRREALRDMSERLDVPDLTTFAAAIIQADQLGVSIGKILRVQADQMRVKRRQRAQEKAQQAPVKMMIPMVFLIFPSIWIVLMGPSVIFLVEQGIVGGI
ncbi:MAG: type II secretion system F family protein [Chloroflexi bacterium]|nr:type II secretion system F family protein [Chloroflexota bacterium]